MATPAARQSSIDRSTGSSGWDPQTSCSAQTVSAPALYLRLAADSLRRRWGRRSDSARRSADRCVATFPAGSAPSESQRPSCRRSGHTRREAPRSFAADMPLPLSVECCRRHLARSVRQAARQWCVQAASHPKWEYMEACCRLWRRREERTVARSFLCASLDCRWERSRP